MATSSSTGGREYEHVDSCVAAPAAAKAAAVATANICSTPPNIPDSHPRAESLRTRHRLVESFECGMVAAEGLLAHGRGEAFDYLLGEKSSEMARRACRAAAAALYIAERPVISVNGNLAALCPADTVHLARLTGARLEINLFYDSQKRRAAIARHLYRHGATSILGTDPERMVVLSGTDSARRMVDENGIMVADVVVVPLEDGDRTSALKRAGKRVIAFDLNPLSRTARTADIAIVDNITRAIRLLAAEYHIMTESRMSPREIIAEFDNERNLKETVSYIVERNLAVREEEKEEEK